jgi:hypothetical protein
MSAVLAHQLAPKTVGEWKVIVHAPELAAKDVTFFRGFPTTLGDWTFSDPFGPGTASVTFPGVTMLDRLGEGDLDWLVCGADVDIVWVPAAGEGDPQFSWEGYAVDLAWSTGEGLTVSLVGALHQLDNYLAKPEYPSRPITYEAAISRQFIDRPDLRCRQLKVEWPDWWPYQFNPHGYTHTYYIPTGVSAGENWTGLVTRQTGSWDATLTSYITTLLTSMYTYRGRWTIDLDPGRQPVLRHRDNENDADPLLVVVNPAMPGVKMDLNYDWSQTLNVAYGQGKTLQGVGYSGQEVSGDGQRTTYEPLAALRQVSPISDKNGWLQPHRMRKEVLLQMQDGLEVDQAQEVGRFHLDHFSDPGVTGTIELSVDPLIGGAYQPHATIKAGMRLQVLGLFGQQAGVLMHVTEVGHSPASGTTTLTVDSKHRDALTLAEVRLRGRDALSIQRSLIGGQYQSPIPDQLLPWNYAQGSGYIPSGPAWNAKRLFDGIPDSIEFPWTEWTTQRPPASKSYRSCYARIGPASTNADNNWATLPKRDNGQGVGGKYGFSIRMAQAGQIRLLQLAAYDIDGNVMAVPFHFSLYYSSGVNVQSMPALAQSDVDAMTAATDAQNAAIDAANAATTPPGTTPHVAHSPYRAGQHYPFFPAAWERYNSNGTQMNRPTTVESPGAGFVRGYGTGFVQAGYWPGASRLSDPPTGKLVDETVFDFDTNASDFNIDPLTTHQLSQYAGYIHGMIYCDAQGPDREVFFAGRMFRVEPGSSA